MLDLVLRLILPILFWLGLFAGVSQEVAVPPPSAPLVEAASAPEPYDGWQQFDNGVFRLLYPPGWEVLIDSSIQVAVLGESMFFRIDLPHEAERADQFSLEEQDLALTTLYPKEALYNLRPMFEMDGRFDVEFTEIEYSRLGGRQVFMDLAWIATLTSTAANGPLPEEIVVIPRVACSPAEMCVVMFSALPGGTISGSVWEMADKIMGTVEIIR